MRISEDLLSSSYKKRVLTHFEISQDLSVKFNYISRNYHSVKFKVIYAGFLYFLKCHKLQCVKLKVMPLLYHPSSRLNQPLNLVDCLCVDFSNINIVSSRKEVVVCLDFFFCKNCLYK